MYMAKCGLGEAEQKGARESRRELHACREVYVLCVSTSSPANVISPLGAAGVFFSIPPWIRATADFCIISDLRRPGNPGPGAGRDSFAFPDVRARSDVKRLSANLQGAKAKG
jgi:hypothetical protein